MKKQTLYVGVSQFDTPPLHTSVYALDAQSGATQWSNTLVQAGNDISYQFLQVVNGVAYVAYATHTSSTSYTDTVDALSTKDGRLLWRYQVDDQYEGIHTMIVCNGIVYLGITRFGPGAVAGTTSIVVALQASDAKLLWCYSSADSSYYDQLEVTDTMLYLITAKNLDAQNYTVLSTMHALYANNGEEVWQKTYTTYALGVVATATNSVIYAIVPSHTSIQKYDGSEIHALQASDGTLVWHAKASLGSAITRKAVTNDLLYLDANDRLCAFSLTDGTLRWCSDGAHDATLLNGGDFIYTTNAQQVCALQPTDGKKRWCVSYPNIGSTILASDSAVYVASNFAGTLYALRKSDGSKLWYRQIDNAIFGLAFEE
ncbi:MAG TPA: PQQ-binding-like beta-propeller repeat protein [Ktedonobacteraceae bacterium]|nr:PQQ-binding-like beta-propeller repeat protein [Ktedonobacteraceae bacterium]